MLDEYKKLAARLVALKSVSTDPSLKDECKKTAEFLKELLVSYGFTVELIDGYGNPVVLASYIIDPKLETCLIYGHYDVQPASKEDGWESDPFELFEKDNRFYGRGIMDDKCQFLIHMLTIGKLIKEKKLGYNVKFLFEGNEEEGSPYIEKFVKDHVSELACDFILISDGEKIQGKPTLELGNRGILNCTLTIITATQDNHSGLYGGVVPNPVHELSKIIATLHDSNNRIAIEGFYDDVEKIDSIDIIPFDFEDYKKNTGTKTVFTEPEYDFYTQVGLRPSLHVTGISGGYTKAHKTVVPTKATALLNFRIVKSQKKDQLIELIKRHLEKIVPNYAEYVLTVDEFAPPSKTEKNNKFVDKARDTLEQLYKEKVVYVYVGAVEPVIAYFQEFLNKPILFVPLSAEDGHMHGINENFTIQDIEMGFQFSEEFFRK